MPGRFHLTEDDERIELETRERLRHAQSRLRELRDRRGLLLEQVRRLSDEQHVIHDRMAPEQERVEGAHEEYRALGQRLAEIRRERDALRPRLDAALAELRMATPVRPERSERRERGPMRPDQIRQEMAQLELRQQTQALSLTDENALIDRLRQLRRELETAEQAVGERAKLDAARAAKELTLRELRTKFEQLGDEFGRVRGERDRKMQSMRAQLQSVGQEISQIREKAQERAGLFRKVDDLNRMMVEVDREIRETLQASRARLREARDTISEFTRPNRAAVSAVAAQAADEQLDRLMKNGKITLGG